MGGYCCKPSNEGYVEYNNDQNVNGNQLNSTGIFSYLTIFSHVDKQIINAGACYDLTSSDSVYCVIKLLDLFPGTENLAFKHQTEDIWNADNASVESPTMTHQRSMPLHFGETGPSNEMTHNETENVDLGTTRNSFLNVSGSIRSDVRRNLSHGLNEGLANGNRDTPFFLYFDVPENSDVYVNENCSNCFLVYNEQNKQPRILPCGHIICNECLNTLASENQFTMMICPHDEQVFQLTAERNTGI